MGGVIHMKEKMIVFVKKETVLVVAAILAVMSAFFVHPDQAYIDYIDFRVLGILLSLMIIMAGASCAYEKYGAAGICSCFSVFLFKHGHYQ